MEFKQNELKQILNNSRTILKTRRNNTGYFFFPLNDAFVSPFMPSMSPSGASADPNNVARLQSGSEQRQRHGRACLQVLLGHVEDPFKVGVQVTLLWIEKQPSGPESAWTVYSQLYMILNHY